MKLAEETCDAPCCGGVTFDLAAPSVLGCLCRKSELGGMPLAEALGVGGGRDELRAREVQPATRSLGGKAEAVPELEFPS